LSNYLFIQLPADKNAEQISSVQWLHWDSKLGYSVGRGEARPSDLAKIAQQHSHSINVLITPGETVRSLNVKLPNKSKAAISTIPFQLEDQLCSKLEDLHIASGRVIDKQVCSLVVEHQKMRQWKTFSEQCEINFRYIVPDFSLLPTTADIGSLWSDGQRILVNSNAFQGSLSALAYQHFSATFWPNLKTQLAFYSAGDYLEEFPRETTRTNTDLLNVLAQRFSEIPSATLINLAQGEYQVASQSNLQLKRFFAPAIAAGLLALTLLALSITDNYQLEKKNKQLKTQMVSLYKVLFPRDRRVTDPYAQMRGKLKNSATDNNQNFLSWMALVAPALTQHKIKLVNLKYDTQPNVLRLQIEASDYNSLENLASAINQQSNTLLSASLGTLQKSSLSNSVTSLLTLKASLEK